MRFKELKVEDFLAIGCQISAVSYNNSNVGDPMDQVSGEMLFGALHTVGGNTTWRRGSIESHNGDNTIALN